MKIISNLFSHEVVIISEAIHFLKLQESESNENNDQIILFGGSFYFSPGRRGTTFISFRVRKKFHYRRTR